MNIGILGGTFDPVHNAHLLLARCAQEAFALDLVLFIPAGEPWRKSHRTITPAEHRLAMLRLAIEGNDAYGISDVELRREGPSYTADTLEALSGERLDDAFWFIMGADALADMANWHEPERIVRHAILAVAARGDERIIAPIDGIEGKTETFEMPRSDISSSGIRALVAGRKPIDTLVPPAVAAYIDEHRLYRAP